MEDHPRVKGGYHEKHYFAPLDERPCNFDFPSKIFNGEKYTIIRPEHLGQKKTPASYEFIRDFLIANIEKVDAAVISIDTLLYGGLIPSRLHHLSEETVLERLMLLKELREKNPQVKLYAFQCIMRCPKYSSDDEEPVTMSFTAKRFTISAV